MYIDIKPKEEQKDKTDDELPAAYVPAKQRPKLLT